MTAKKQSVSLTSDRKQYQDTKISEPECVREEFLQKLERQVIPIIQKEFKIPFIAILYRSDCISPVCPFLNQTDSCSILEWVQNQDIILFTKLIHIQINAYIQFYVSLSDPYCLPTMFTVFGIDSQFGNLEIIHQEKMLYSNMTHMLFIIQAKYVYDGLILSFKVQGQSRNIIFSVNQLEIL